MNRSGRVSERESERMRKRMIEREQERERTADMSPSIIIPIQARALALRHLALPTDNKRAVAITGLL